MTKPKNKLQQPNEPIQPQNKVHRSGAVVTVACKMPSGLILRTFDMVDHDEPVMGGGTKTVKRAEQRDEVVRLNGTVSAFGEIPTHRIIGGYALTQNVPKDFWDLWLAQNQDLDAVKNKLVFAYESMAHAEGQAAEQKSVKSGLEPLNPDPAAKDPRIPRGIKTADKEKAA